MLKVSKVIINIDNCSRENKSWYFFGAMLEAVNSQEFLFQTINVKYLEKGHTNMSADSAHQIINKKLKSVKMEDYDDYVNKINELSFQVNKMHMEDFKFFENPVSLTKLNCLSERPYISQFKEVKFSCNSLVLQYRTNFSNSFKSLDFKKLTWDPLQQSPSIKKYKGIPKNKKNDIMKTVLPLIFSNKRTFWENLEES